MLALFNTIASDVTLLLSLRGSLRVLLLQPLDSSHCSGNFKMLVPAHDAHRGAPQSPVYRSEHGLTEHILHYHVLMPSCMLQLASTLGESDFNPVPPWSSRLRQPCPFKPYPFTPSNRANSCLSLHALASSATVACFETQCTRDVGRSAIDVCASSGKGFEKIQAYSYSCGAVRRAQGHHRFPRERHELCAHGDVQERVVLPGSLRRGKGASNTTCDEGGLGARDRGREHSRLGGGPRRLLANQERSHSGATNSHARRYGPEQVVCALCGVACSSQRAAALGCSSCLLPLAYST